MPDDILDVAKGARVGTPTSPPPPEPPAPTPPLAPTDEIAAKEKVVDEILHTEVTTPVAPPSQTTPPQKSGAGKKGTKIAILLLLLMLPVAVYFISLQNEQLGELRSRAEAPGPYEGVTNREECEALGEVVTEPGSECGCGGYRVECVINGQHYTIGCETNPTADCGGDNPTPTPTPGNAPQCNLVKVYKGGVVVSDLSSLSVGDDIVIAVAGNNASKGRIRLNGGAFTEVPTPTNGEYQLSHTILAAEIVNNKITIEAEIFGTDGNWH